jgi:hypothetical protein
MTNFKKRDKFVNKRQFQNRIKHNTDGFLNWLRRARTVHAFLVAPHGNLRSVPGCLRPSDDVVAYGRRSRQTGQLHLDMKLLPHLPGLSHLDTFTWTRNCAAVYRDLAKTTPPRP